MAVQNVLDPLQLALSCVTQAVINVRGGYHPAPEPHVLLLGDGGPVRLPGDPALALSLLQRYRIVKATEPHGHWKVTTSAYAYTLETEGGSELIAYHWHPNERSAVTFPHLHLGAGALIGRPEFTKAHLPTGRVAIEDVLRLAIREFGVHPRRDDWETLLGYTRAAYDEWRTW